MEAIDCNFSYKGWKTMCFLFHDSCMYHVCHTNSLDQSLRQDSPIEKH